MSFQTALLAVIGACFSIISFFLIDTLRGLRKSIDNLNASFRIQDERLHDHETRITILERV